MISRQPMTTRYYQGTSLVEVLIAAVIIGIGLLGIASLQVKALQGSTEAEFRAKATDLAWALADRIRTNLNADNSYVTATISACPTPSAGTPCSMIPGTTPITAGSCTPVDVAADDLENIFCAANAGIDSRLPGGTLQVTCTDNDVTDADACSPGSQMDITIAWQTRDDPFGAGDNTDRIIMPIIPGAPE